MTEFVSIEDVCTTLAAVSVIAAVSIVMGCVGESEEPVVIDDDAGVDESDVATECESPNACGGCGDLDGEPERSCGPCSDGVYECVDEETVECVDASGENDCGGCSLLPAEPGEVCMPGGVWVCDGQDDVTCLYEDNVTSPQVTTLEATDIGARDVTFEGEITELGTPTVTHHGYCVSTESTPTECYSEGPTISEGTFSITVDGLAEDTPYNARAYVSNGVHDDYGDTVGLTTGIDAEGWQQLSTGRHYSCGIRNDDTLWCWGFGDNGRLGVGDTDKRLAPHQVGDDDDWASITLGWIHGCGIRDDDTLWCWGDGEYMQLGLDDDDDRTTPQQVGDDQWASVAPGRYHTCGIRADDTLWCWGGVDAANDGLLGVGHTEGASTPQQVGDEQWLQVSSNWAHSCGIRADDTLWCWGSNSRGRLGVGDTDDRTTPEQVGDDQWIGVSVGRVHTCGVRDDHTLWCWGANSWGQLGNGQAGEDSEAPDQVGSSDNWTSELDAGDLHNCGVRDDHTLWCWGHGESGQLGQGDMDNIVGYEDPVKVGVRDDWQSISASFNQSCGIRGADVAMCWGSNSLGEIGIDSPDGDIVPSPAMIEHP